MSWIWEPVVVGGWPWVLGTMLGTGGAILAARASVRRENRRDGGVIRPMTKEEL